MATTMMATEQLLLIKATEKNIERKRIILLRKLFAARMTKIIERKRLIKQTKYFVMEIVNFFAVIDTVELHYLCCCLPTHTLLEDDDRFIPFP